VTLRGKDPKESGTTTRRRLTVVTEREREDGHEPRWEYDCERCKFNWNCGPTCRCLIRGPHYAHLPATPPRRQREVDAALVAAGLQPEFRARAFARLRNPS
jgi:hypothetical protein